MNTPTYVVSDLHLGSAFCRAERFLEFLKGLPENAALVLNGDTVTRWNRKLTKLDMAILDRLREESERRKIIWVRGNHDEHFKLENPASIEFTDKHIVDDDILIRHGHESDSIRTFFWPLIHVMYHLHRLRLWLGLSELSTSSFAKQVAFLYKPYKELFIRNALRYAERTGYKTVILGHIHSTDDRQVNGIRYLNTGSWIEPDISYAKIEDGKVTLEKLKEEKHENRQSY